MHETDPVGGLPLDHIAIAVESIDAALPKYESLLGAAGSPRERVESQGVVVCFVGAGPARVELLEPLGPESPVGRFLDRRGPGLHHVAFRVTDLEARLQTLAGQGFELIDTAPRPGAHGHRVAFLHPRGVGGVLVELVEP